MKGSLNALKKVGIVLLLLLGALILFTPKTVKAAYVYEDGNQIDVDDEGKYRIDVQNKKSYVINLKMGETIGLKFWLGKSNKESSVQDWHWDKEGSGRTAYIEINENEKIIGKDEVYITGKQNSADFRPGEGIKYFVHNTIGVIGTHNYSRCAEITFNVFEDPLYAYAYKTDYNVENIKGDLNSDGIVSSIDLALMEMYRDNPETPINIENARMDADEIIDARENGNDYILLKAKMNAQDVNEVMKGHKITIGTKISPISDGFDNNDLYSIEIISSNPGVASAEGGKTQGVITTKAEGITQITVIRKYGWDTEGYQKKDTFYLKVKSNEISEGDFKYRIENGKATVIECLKSESAPVVIPAEVQGYPVIGIAKDSFIDTKVTKITIPASVRNIEAGAFNTSNSMNASVYLKEIAVEDGNPSYFAVNGILYEYIEVNEEEGTHGDKIRVVKCPEDWEGTELVLPANVTEIGAYAFYGCSKLTNITLPEGLKVIMEYAFNRCTSIDEMILPDGIETIAADTDVFTGISAVGYKMSKEANGERVLTDTYETMSKYVATCDENIEKEGGTTEFCISDQIEIEEEEEEDNGEYIGVPVIDGVANINMEPDNWYDTKVSRRYKITMKVGQKVRLKTSNTKDYNFYIDDDDKDANNNLLDYSPYIRIDSSKDLGFFSVEYFYYVTAKAKMQRYSPKVILRSDLGKYKAIIKIEIIEPEIYITGNVTRDQATAGDINRDGILSNLDYHIYYKASEEERKNMNFDIDGDGQITEGDARLFKASNKVYVEDKIDLFGLEEVGYNVEKNNIVFTSSNPNVATIDGNKIIFKDAGTVTITANRKDLNNNPQSKKDTIEFVVENRTKQNDIVKYRINEDGTITIVEYIGAITGEIGIPGTIEGLPVTGIDPNIFKKDAKDLKTIIIPASVTNIADDAFDGAINLERFIVENGNNVFLASEDGVLYKFNEKGELILFKCPNSFIELKIPEKINEIKVTEIGSKAFYNNKNIKSIETTNNIEKIGDSAFEGCTALNSIAIPVGIRLFLGNRVFAGCTGLSEADLTIPGSLEQIGKEIFDGARVKTVYYYKYQGCEIMGNYLNDTEKRGDDSKVTYVMKDAEFEDENSGLLYQVISNIEGNEVQVVGLTDKAKGQVVVPASIYVKQDKVVPADTEGAVEFKVTKMIELALSANPAITSFEVGINVNDIASNTFRNLPNLDEISVVRGNESYISDGKILYKIKEKDEENNIKSLILVKYPNKLESSTFSVNKVQGIPVVEIAAYAFEDCKNLVTLNISGETVKTIGNNAFYNCEKLQNLVIPEKVVLGTTLKDRNIFNGIKGPVIEYISNFLGSADAVTSYFVENDDPVQYAVVYLDPWYDGCIDVLMKKPTAEEESTIKKIKLVSASGKVQVENIEDYKQELIGTGTVPSSSDTYYTSRIRIKAPGGYEVRLIDKDSNEITVANIDIPYENFKYLINYHPNVEKENIIKMPETGLKPMHETARISDMVPEAQGRRFTAWNTKPDGTGTRYDINAEYSADEDLDLYAIWITDAEAAQSIDITGLPNKTEYVVGQKFSRDGLKIRVTYGNGSTNENPTGQIIIENENEPLTVVGTHIVKVKYVENNVTTPAVDLPITVIAKTMTLNVEGTPAEQIENTEFNKTGIKVNAVYNDGTKALDVKNYTVQTANEGNKLSLGANEVIIKYTDEEGVSGETTINVTARKTKLNALEVIEEPTTIYVEGQYFNFDNKMKIVAKYDNGTSSEPLSKKTANDNGYILSDESTLVPGSKIVTILYSEGEITKSVTRVLTVSTKKVVSIRVEEPEQPAQYVEGMKFDKTAIKVTAIYNDGEEKELTPDEFKVNNDQPLTLNQNSAEVKYVYTNKHGETSEPQEPKFCRNFTTIAKAFKEVKITVKDSVAQYAEIPVKPEGIEVREIFNDGTEGENPLVLDRDYTIENRNTVLIPGENLIFIKYKDQTIQVKVNALPNEISSIAIKTQPTNKEGNIEETVFEPQGMELTVNCTNGTTKTITSGWTVSNNILQVGDNTVQVTYGGKTTQINGIKARAKQLQYITIDASGARKLYNEGEMFEVDKVKVTPHYDNGKTGEPVTSGFIVNGGRPLTAGDNQEIVVNYNGFTATIKGVYVNAITIKGITVDKAKLTYLEGEEFSTSASDLVVYKVYSDSDTHKDPIDNSKLTIIGGTNLYTGKNITISYTENGKPYTATVKIESVEKPLPANPIKDGSDIEIKDDKYIDKVQPGTDVDKIKDYIVEGYTLKVFKADGETEVTKGLIGTGMIARIYKGDQKVYEYVIVVLGDTTGEGTVDFFDILEVNKHRLNWEKLEGAYAEAADVTYNNAIDFYDILEINKFRLGYSKKF